MVERDRVLDLLNYDQHTGLFKWKQTRCWRAKAGSVAGKVDFHGYIVIGIDGKLYKAHRLAYLILVGQAPTRHLDHVDGNRANNAWLNLRPANNVENGRNAKLRRDNASGCKGVYLHKASNRWHARIKLPGKVKSLGYYPSREMAAAAYDAAAQNHFGEFARLNVNL